MTLKGKKIAILAEQDFQDLELNYPRLRLLEAGADVLVAGTGSSDEYTDKYGYPVKVDKNIDEIQETELNALIIPGGWAPDKMRLSKGMLELVQKMDAANKVIGCICHGGWVLASANILRNRKMTSYIAVKDDMENAGAEWADEQVVIDGNLITSRNPNDLPAFTLAIIKALGG